MNQLVNDNQNDKHSEEKIAVVVPCALSEFGEFLSKLLTKPQSLKSEIEGVFDITIKDISNAFHLVDQRITSQNSGTLANFEIKITYNNGTSISHKTVKEFEEYYPTEPGTPKEVVLSFIYLIRFNERDSPEKQEIEIVFVTNPNRKHERTKWYASGLIEWKIEHTERTWASDMNGLLKNHASHCVSKHSGLWHWLSRQYEDISNNTATLILATSLVLWLLSTFSFLKTNPDTIKLAHYYTASLVSLFILYLTLGTIVRFVTLRLIVRKESFICLVDKDFDDKKKRLSKSKRRLAYYGLSFIFSIAAGIVANIIYNTNWAQGI